MRSRFLSRFYIPARAIGWASLFCLILASRSTPAQSAAKPELVVQTGHSGSVNAVAFSSDGAWLASASSDKTVRLWNVATGRQVRTFAGHLDSVTSVVFSPDGRLLASGSRDYTARIWEVASGRQLSQLGGYIDPPTVLSFSPDGHWLATNTYRDRFITICDVASGTKTRKIETNVDHEAAFSPDWHLVAFTTGTEILVENADSKEEVGHFGGFDEIVSALAFSADGRHFAALSATHTAKVWDLTNGQTLFSMRVSRATSIGEAEGHLALSPDGRWLVTAGGPEDGNSIRVWDVAKGTLARDLPGHSASANGVAFSPDGKWVASGGGDSSLKLWNSLTAEQSIATTGLGPVNAIAFRPGGRYLAIGSSLSNRSSMSTEAHPSKSSAGSSWSSVVSVWDLAAGLRIRSFPEPDAAIQEVNFGPDGRSITALMEDMYQPKDLKIRVTDYVKTWDAETGQPGRTTKESSICFSPDGRLRAEIHNQEIQLIEVGSGHVAGKLQVSFIGKTGWVHHPLFSPDGQLAAAWSNSIINKTTGIGESVSQLQVWNLATFKPVAYFVSGWYSIHHPVVLPPEYPESKDTTEEDSNKVAGASERAGDFGAIAFSPDGKRIAALSSNQHAKVWDIGTGELLRDFEIAVDLITPCGLAFSPDGRFLAAGSAANTVELLDLSAGTKTSLAGHTGSVTQVIFSPDSRWLVSGSTDGSARIWDVQSGQQRLALYALANGRDWLAVAPDGLFDGTADALQEVSWREGTNGTITPLASFFTDFYHPGLLAEALSDNPPRAQVDIATMLQLPGLRNLLAQKLARVDQREGRPVVCFEQLPAVAVQAPAEAGPDLPAEINGFRVVPADTTCKYQRPLPAGLESVGSDSLQSRSFTTPWDGKPSDTSKSTLHILTVGIGQYPPPSGFDPLPYAASSAHAIEDYFRNESTTGERPYAQIRVWPGLFDAEATRNAVRQRLTDMAAAMAPEDVVLLYLAGHGIAPLGEEMFYFVPADGRDIDIGHTGLDTAILAEALRNMPARRILLLIDACQSGGAVEALSKIGEIKARAEQSRSALRQSGDPSPEDGVGVHIVAATLPLQYGVQIRANRSAMAAALLDSFNKHSGHQTVIQLIQDLKALLPEISGESVGYRQVPLTDSIGLDFPIGAH